MLDAIDEWMELEVLPLHFELRPEKREILGPGRSVGFEAGEHAWFLDLDGSEVSWERGRRGAADADDVTGDLELFKLWRTHVRFG
ncbi:hypothetical protein [Amycolatopsis speibonae]|uniref:SMI1/KNR4 family protein n=1 Tax=Amycolatopsis speibonae TaxID=1450224 RepID=A0ABV7NYB0_9PSEU